MFFKELDTVLFNSTNIIVLLQTLLNEKGTYIATLLSAYIVLVVMGVLAFRAAGGTCFNLHKVITRKSHSTEY